MKTLAAQTALAIERAALDGEVREARLQVEANALRAALFSSVTHDLRTPLSSIKASASGSPRRGRPLQRRGAAGRAPHGGRGSRPPEPDRRQPPGSRPDAGGGARSLEAADPDRRGDRLGAPADATLPGRVVVRTTIRPELPAVDADPVQIGQVLSNIIENAIRFSPQGSEIHIAAARWRSAIQVRVTDQGPGIPAGRPRAGLRGVLSTRCGRRDGAEPVSAWRSRGRSSSRTAARSRASAAPGGGTAVTFELPIATREPRTTLAADVARGSAVDMTRVLVIDDEPQILRALRRSLEAQDYEVATAEGGEEGLALAAAQHAEPRRAGPRSAGPRRHGGDPEAPVVDRCAGHRPVGPRGTLPTRSRRWTPARTTT